MKKFFVISALLALFCLTAAAQDVKVPEGYVLVDSLVYRMTGATDESLAGKSIFSVLNSTGGVAVHQDASVSSAMAAHVAKNSKARISGYRVRIFFDNKQNSRGASEAAMRRFQGAFPGIPAYRSFSSPFFKVTVGDFRTKSEASQMLHSLKGMFPSAFIIKENINFPAADRDNAYVVDTVKVLRPISEVSDI